MTCIGSSRPWRSAEGYQVVEVAVPQHPSNARIRLYGPATYARRLLDLAAFFFLAKFTEKPLRFFGLVGSLFFASARSLPSFCW